jgi:RHS repeat-associated protein
VPGAGWARFVYDKNDRIVLKNDDQDGSNYWHFTKYDALSRPVMMGLLSNIGTTSRQTLQTAFDNFTGQNYEDRTPPLGAGGLLAYTNVSFPSAYTVADADVKMVNYYDDFNWNINVNYTFDGTKAFHVQGGTKGLLTGTLTRNIETNDWYRFSNHYDYKGRIIQQFSQNHLGNIDRTDYQYRFNNEILAMRLTHKKTGENDLVELYQYDYDHIGRKTRFRHSIGDIQQTIASYNYDNIGRLSVKNIKPIYENKSKCTCPWIDPKSWTMGSVPTQTDNVIISLGTDITIPAGTVANARTLTFEGGRLRNFGRLNLGNFGSKLPATAPSSLTDPVTGALQSVDYQYHIRGGLRGINLNLSNNTSIGSGDLFSMKLGYETDGYFDGNIGKQEFMNSVDNINRSFTYTYDGASRIISGTYAGTGSENYSLNFVTYDANGNIKTLSRSGNKSNSTFGLIDNLAYTYNANSNKILKVDDLANETASFRDISGNDYTYSLDGSLTSDANKGITLIEYNYLKLPRRVVQNGVTTLYQYDATGKKLKETIGTQVTDYAGNKIYKNNILYQIGHDEGRIVDNQYEYNIKDHLGNLRVAFRDNEGIAEIVQANSYGVWGEELTGLSYQSNASKRNYFTFLGREELPELGLVDLQKRLYDRVLGRFISVDPSPDVEGQESLSPYQYSWNNPVLRSDPNGDCPTCFVGFIVGAGVDYGFQVAGNLANGRSLKESLTNVDRNSIIISGVAGALTSGLSAIGGKGAQIAITTAIDVTESVAKQATSGDGNITLTQTVSDVVSNKIAGAVTKGAENVINTKTLSSEASRTARVSLADPSSTGRATRAATAQSNLNTTQTVNKAVGQTASGVVGNTIQNTSNTIRTDKGTNSTTSNYNVSVAPSDATRVVQKPIILIRANQ